MHDLAHRYFLKTLTDKEAEQFEIHLLDCKKCQMQLALWQTAARNMRADRKFYSVPTILKRPVSRRAVGYFAIAAVILLAIASRWHAYCILPDHYGLARLTTETNLIRLKAEEPENSFAEALTHLREKRFSPALTGLQKILAENPTNFQTNYYTGLAHLAAGEKQLLWYHWFDESHTRQSIQFLETAGVLAGNNDFYFEECLWLLAKARLRLGETEACRNALQLLLTLDTPDLVYRDAATAMLQQLPAR